MQTIGEWLETLGLGEFAPVFEAERITPDLVARLAESDLKELGLPMGPRKRILAAAADAAAVADEAPAGAAAAEPAAAGERGAERRQITVMFCDLVGSTRMSEELDPEDLRAIMQAYQKAAGAVIERYGGHVAQYLGDGLMVYFGWPTAHEDDAERAVRAALEIVGEVKTVPAPAPLAVRIGLATGPVVVGETGAGDAAVPKLAVGETPNLAARVQGLAGADEIVLAHATRRLIAGAFDLDDLGPHVLKGIVEPVRVWRARGVAETADRFAARGGVLAPLVGRETEIALLADRWQRSRAGEGQAVALSGEAGIGKSRITRALIDLVAPEPHHLLRLQCSSYLTSSALHPFAEAIARAAGLVRDDDNDTQLAKIEALLAGVGERPSVPLFASLLSVDAGDRYPPLAATPQKRKDDTLHALAGYVEALARDRPLLTIFEDAHWIDPTSQEALDLIVARAAAVPALVVVTHRPDYDPPWAGRGHVTALALSRLGRAQAAAIVERVTGGRSLPDVMLDRIVAKTDGVPLFVEELTKTVIESGLLAERDGAYELTGTLSDIAIPATLQDSLMARLDRLAPARELAQIGACIGREFSLELLIAVAPFPEPETRAALDRLIASELVFRSGGATDPGFTFKHALVQDAAYQSLLKSRRRQHHLRIAEVLSARFPEHAARAPEDLARHYSAAGDLDHALPLWEAAADNALGRFANVEALRHADSGLALIAAANDSAPYRATAARLQIKAASALRILDRLDEALRRLEGAEALCLEAGDESDLSMIHFLRGNLCFPLGQFERCQAEHEQALAYARRSGSVEDEVRALGGLGDAAYAGGRMGTAREHFAAFVDLCDRHKLGDFGLGNRSMLAITTLYTGDIEKTRRRAEDALARAHAAGDSRAEILALHANAFLEIEIDDVEAARAHLDSALALTRTIGSLRFEAETLMFLADLAPPDAVELASEALAICRQQGVMAYIGPAALGTLAVVCGDPDQRAALIAEAEDLLAAGSLSHNHFWFRAKAIDIALGAGDWDAARRHADLLEAYVAAESLLWMDCTITRARLLATLGENPADAEARDALIAIRDRARAAGLTRIERAITASLAAPAERPEKRAGAGGPT